MPTPAGVPVAMIVPGNKVIPEESSSMISAMPVIKRLVLECWRSSPLTLEEIARAGGKATSSAVVIQGPIGVKPSSPLPKYHCL